MRKLRRRSFKCAGFLSVALIVVACDPGIPSDQEVDLRSLDLPRWGLEVDFRLGSLAGEHDSFTLPASLAIDADNNFYVLDIHPQQPFLRVFDPSGRFLRQIGRLGSGPGEYRAPISFGLLGDTVWIVDRVNGISFFQRRDGGIIDQVRIPPDGSGPPTLVPISVLGTDAFLALVPAGPNLRESGVGPVTFQQFIVRLDRMGTVVDTLVGYTAEPGVTVTPRGISAYQPVRDAPIVSYHASSNEIRETHRRAAQNTDVGEFGLSVRRLSDGSGIQRTFRYRPIPIPSIVRDSIRNEARSQLAGFDQEHMQIALEYLYLPPAYPPVSSGPVTALDGTVWIGRESIPGRPPTYLVLDSLYAPLATVELPANALRRVGPITGEHVWVIEKDEWDVQYMVRYRILR